MATDSSKLIDGFQVIKSVFDIDRNCLRVCIVDGSGGGSDPIEVIIDHTTDSIRLGDGATLVSVTTLAGKSGLDVNIINNDLVSTPNITRITTIANTEFSHAFDSDMKRFELIVEGDSRLQYAYTATNSGTDYDILYPGVRLVEDKIKQGSNISIYFRTRKSSTVIIKEWK